ncbi:MAG: restriction endonuclease [Bacteroides sp.]|uniref:restriction endonuclease n=1 Tax=Bacteroides sp. TaxID=29523 RepID=UPI002FCBAF6B
MHILLDAIGSIDTLDKRSVFMLLLVLLFSLFLMLRFGLRNRVRWKQVRNIRTAANVLERIQNLPAPAALSYLRKIDPFVFEELLLTAFERKGNRVIRNQRYTGDGGIDGRIMESGKLILIQAKRYKSYVSKQHLTTFLALIRKTGASRGYFIHTGKTGVSTIKEFSSDKLTIISGQKLIDLLRDEK